MSANQDQHQRLVQTILTDASEDQKQAMVVWIQTLLDIRESALPVHQKAIDALRVTARSGVAVPVVKAIGKKVVPESVTALADDLISIKNDKALSNGDKLAKASKMAFESIKSVAWDDRGLMARAGIVSAVVAAVLFGSQGAGVAALGTAIGVPLWVVFGAGGAFVAALYQELTGHKHVPRDPKKSELMKVD